jgi:hypothetical protein
VDWTILVPLAIALVAPVGAYVLAARRLSGRIATTEAAQLWAESASIRDDYRTRLLQAEERALSVEIRMSALETKNNELTRENYQLIHRVEACETAMTARLETIATLEATVQQQREELGRR